MKLKSLFADIPDVVIHGSADEVRVKGVTTNSKEVAFGDLFIAKKGKTFDGGAFVSEAVKAGAVAILVDHYDPSLSHVVQVIHPSVASIEADVAVTFYQYPSDELLMVGITGTNGKTTTSFLIKNLLDQWIGPCGLIGTIEYIMGSHRSKASRTTPEVSANHKMLREMRNHGCQSAVMEVTSHALVQGRVDLIDFDVAVYTNLTLDHLDYHQTMEAYCQAKNQLFRSMKANQWAVVNRDSPWVDKIVEGCAAKMLTYGIDAPADLSVSSLRFENGGSRATVSYQGKEVDCFWPLTGRFNAYNCLAAMGVVISQGIPFEKIAEMMQHLPSVRGRLEPVQNHLGLQIYVDFAHSDDALKNILRTLNEVKQGRIFTVFGCGGDRDKTKRPKMGEVSEFYSDFTIVTLDNPRSEDPMTICQEIAAGFKKQDAYIIELDRKAAIKKAIEGATPQDIVLIAGKGHESHQIFADRTIEFDDVSTAREICNQLRR